MSNNKKITTKYNNCIGPDGKMLQFHDKGLQMVLFCFALASKWLKSVKKV